MLSDDAAEDEIALLNEIFFKNALMEFNAIF